MGVIRSIPGQGTSSQAAARLHKASNSTSDKEEAGMLLPASSSEAAGAVGFAALVGVTNMSSSSSSSEVSILVPRWGRWCDNHGKCDAKDATSHWSNGRSRVSKNECWAQLWSGEESTKTLKHKGKYRWPGKTASVDQAQLHLWTVELNLPVDTSEALGEESE